VSAAFIQTQAPESILHPNRIAGQAFSGEVFKKKRERKTKKGSRDDLNIEHASIRG
jgi:hypothetical protein